jgi:hypothetical protein
MLHSDEKDVKVSAQSDVGSDSDAHSAKLSVIEWDAWKGILS